MSLVLRNITRTIKGSTETTLQTKEANADALAFVLTTSDYFYIGSVNKFAARYFHFGTLNTQAGTLVVQYWDGSAWTAVEDLVDQTQHFTRSGFVSWVNESDWAKRAQTPITPDPELYWVRISVSANLSAGTSLKAVLNLYCDDTLLKKYYPELISDTRYLPDAGNFLEQYEAARDLVVLRLKADQIIDDESQVIDPNEVCLAAVHAAAHIILYPITNKETDTRATDAERKFNSELNRVRLSLDLDKSGIIEDDEKNYANVFVPRGGY
jgi:hypothetical protein